MAKAPDNIVHGDYFNDTYLLIKEGEELLVVHSDYFHQESAIIFQVGHRMTDWSDYMLLEEAKWVVTLMNNRC